MECELFSGLTPKEKEKALEYFGKRVSYYRKDDIYKAGHLGILLSGSAKVLRISHTGAKTTMRTIGDGAIFGSASIFGEWNESFSKIEAMSACTACYVDEATATRLFDAVPQVAINYIRFLSERIRFLNHKIDTFSAGNTEQKLYEYLSSQVDKNGETEIMMNMSELARRLKIGRSSLYRSIDALEKGGLLIRDKNRFKVN